jgi:hypothetical protein
VEALTNFKLDQPKNSNALDSPEDLHRGNMNALLNVELDQLSGFNASTHPNRRSYI